MTDRQRNGYRLLRPFIPAVNMQIGSADTGLVNFDKDVIDADFGFRNVLKPETSFSFCLYECFHTPNTGFILDLCFPMSSRHSNRRKWIYPSKKKKNLITD